MNTLPEPEVLSCCFEESFTPRLAAMQLRWPDDGTQLRTHVWQFPEGVRLLGPLPERFGVSIHRMSDDAYDVCLVWGRMSLQWNGISRRDLLTGSIGPMLRALGTDIANLLNQPILTDLALLRNAA
jgi:hypothetical protein